MLTWTGLTSTCGRFYIVRKRGYVSLYDTRNRLAGGLTCDSVAEAKAFAAKLTAQDA